MKNILLTKIRLSWYYVIFFVFYFLLLLVLPRYKFDSAALTLFSVNSFLYGFYISPILAGQKARIEELHKIVRTESNAIFTMMLLVKKLPEKTKVTLRQMFTSYLKKCTNNNHKLAEKEYETLISYCIEYQGPDKDDIDKLLEKLVANQQNRTNFTMQLNNRVYSNEWMIMLVLFSITLSFILLIDTGTNILVKVVTALLCTGLSMLILIVVKLSTLTHKKAKQVWEPFKTLIATHYYRIG